MKPKNKTSKQGLPSEAKPKVNHLPEDARQFVECHPQLFDSNPLLKEYMPLRRLVLDRTIMQSIWKKLDEKKCAGVFLGRLMTDVCFWSAADPTPLSEQKITLKRTIKMLDDLIQLTGKSSEVRFFIQMAFEHTAKGLTGKKMFGKIDFKENSPQQNVDFLGFLIHLRDVAENSSASFFSREHKTDSIFPRKMNEPTAFRTFMARSVADHLAVLFKKPKLQMVADILQVMFEDAEGITEDHVRKLIKRKKPEDSPYFNRERSCF